MTCWRGAFARNSFSSSTMATAAGYAFSLAGLPAASVHLKNRSKRKLM